MTSSAITGKRLVQLGEDAVLPVRRHGGDGGDGTLPSRGSRRSSKLGGVIRALRADGLNLLAYDRRGFGETPPAQLPFTHVDDLVAVLDQCGIERACLVGNSMGGALALDVCLAAPDRVSSVLLLGTAVTDNDTPFDWVADQATGHLLRALDEAEAANDVELQISILTQLWLDGPAAPVDVWVRLRGPCFRHEQTHHRAGCTG